MQVANILQERGITIEIDSRPNFGHEYPANFASELPALLARFSR